MLSPRSVARKESCALHACPTLPTLRLVGHQKGNRSPSGCPIPQGPQTGFSSSLWKLWRPGKFLLIPSAVSKRCLLSLMPATAWHTSAYPAEVLLEDSNCIPSPPWGARRNSLPHI